ncbi:FAD-binding domain-containing protein [Aaosphaeria arxii CBS 175.79]|uniref:FAD-binding domain-containing protein n=1 Tax=Aaosphaeria arxii CBS 175.79 TaxID=1450172 RepID=A0A6A5X7G5_9PLEO|nr:FAD-binding domain-containing protein [Aaosphaeria arxii CBS 175.79]KAF2008888.1 FAD-binding domain-containing protein [Aaosphaeria arxii CBS 175.79]
MTISHSLVSLSLVIASYFSQSSATVIRRDDGVPSIRSELGPVLSPEAIIVDSERGNLTEATKRWQVFASPSFDYVVQVANENDIVETVKYANRYSIPFLVVNAGHGEIKSLGGLKKGLQITVRSLKKITVHDNNTATIGGGASNLDITTELWKANKQTVSGTCECVGFLGPLLGGGHGFLQGYHGLAADQLISARVVLANGTIVTASDTSNPKLFWALRGAGHNFGIVTEATVKIYDVPKDDIWYYENFIYQGDSIEAVFGQLNKIKRDTPVQFEHYAVFGRLPQIDPVNALVFFSILYNGPASAADKWVAPFRQFSPIDIQNGTATYPQLSGITGNGINDAICQHENLNRIRYPIYLDRFDPGAGKATFDYFNKTISDHPGLAGSLMLFEGLSTQAVKSVRLDSTAIPHRDYFVLSSPVVTYAPDASLDAIAEDFGRNLRMTLHNASKAEKMHTYVNYAVGEESLENIYGYNSWRVHDLKKHKRAYDPQDRFRWYAPIGV